MERKLTNILHFYLIRFWKSTVEKSKFWTWAVVRPKSDDYQWMLASNRIKIIGNIDLQQIGAGYNENLIFILNFIARNLSILKLKTLNLACTDLSTFCAHTLAFIISRLKEVNMFGTDLRTGQLTVLFSKIHGCRDLRLRSLDIGYNKLSSVSCEIFTQGVLRLAEVNLQNTHLTTEQINYFLEEIRITRDLKMRNLHIGGHDLSSIAPEILTDVFCKLRQLQLWGFYLSKDQLNFIFDHLRVFKYLKLRHLEIHHIKLSSASRYCLAFAICKIEEVRLINSHLVTDQLNVIFHTITNCKTLILRKLNIGGSDFSLVSPEAMSDAVCKLEEVELVGKNLTDYQLETILFQILACSSLKLRKFTVFHNNRKLTILPQNSEQVASILDDIEF